MIKLRTFNLEKIDKIKDYNLLMTLDRDKEINGYISHNFLNWIEKSIDYSTSKDNYQEEEIEVGKPYIIKKDKEFIGILGTLKLSNDGILEVWYAIQKNQRRKGYGEHILGEITPYLIENIKNVEDLELKIDKTNKYSKKVALRNGYEIHNIDNEQGKEIYHYFNKKR